MTNITALSDGRTGTTKNNKNFTKFDARVHGEDFSPAPTVTVWEHVTIAAGESFRCDLDQKEPYKGKVQFWARNVTDLPGPNHAGVAPGKPAIEQPNAPMTVDEAVSLFGKALAGIKQQMDLVFPEVSDADKLAAAQSQATSIFIAVTKTRAVGCSQVAAVTDAEVNELKREILKVMSNDKEMAREVCTTTLSGFEVESFTDLSREEFQSAADLAHTAATRIKAQAESEVPF